MVFSYDFCPMQYKLQYIDGLESRETQAMLMGTRLHEFFDRFFDYYMECDNWYTLIPLEFNDLEYEMACNFISYEKERYKLNEPFEPIFKEIYIETPKYKGTVDRVDDLGNKNVRIVEYKTGTYVDYPKLRQELLFYKRMFELGYPDYTATELRVYYPYHNMVKNLDITKLGLTLLDKKIDKMISVTKSKRFERKCSFQKWAMCGLCKYEEVFPEMNVCNICGVLLTPDKSPVEKDKLFYCRNCYNARDVEKVIEYAKEPIPEEIEEEEDYYGM